MAHPPSSGIYFFPEDDVPPPGDPMYDLHRGQPPFVGGIGVNNFTTIPGGYSHQRATYTDANYPLPVSPVRQQVFLPLVQVSYVCQIVTTTAKTTLTQVFYHPGNRPISKATYTFPLWANCSVVSFTCRVGESKIITGVIKPKEVAKETYEKAANSGQTAGLLEYNTPDVFTTSIGNIPAGMKIKVEIGYILELPHDAEADGIKFTVPLSIAPRYGPPPLGAFGQSGPEVSMDKSLGMEIEITMGEAIKSIESPSHPTAVQLGKHGKGKGGASNQEHDPKKAAVALSQRPAELLKDFVLLITTVTPHFISTPQALLETHPTIPGHQALKVTLAPRFEMPGTEKPENTEIIFLVDRSGSMRHTIEHVKSALRVFLKSLPLGCYFNIISFGSKNTLLWGRSRAYTEGTLNIASEHIETFDASYGGTELLPPLMQAFSRRHPKPGMSTEIMVLTDGEIWRLPELLEYIQQMRRKSGGAVRLFSLGVGESVSHALVQGIATAGGGYSLIVPSAEACDDGLANGLEAKVVRMLNSALTDHIEEYKLHVLQEEGDEEDSESEDEGRAGLRALMTPAHPAPIQVRAPVRRSRRINLFDPTVAPRQRSPTQPRLSDVVPAPSLDNGQDTGNRFSHLKKLQGPEVTQAPFKIPPLFPYERSVVYLLVPPTTKQLKYAKSVTLSATTIAGDQLSLSIPITRIEQPGETVHQLAARMLLRDFEEGKSWLHSDKYGVLGGDPTRFQEYVQREGEAVGMRWSVASKWTSFVGVEEEIMDVAPILTPTPPEEDLSGLPQGRSSVPFILSRPAETSPDSEDSETTGTPDSPPRFDGIPLPKSNPMHSVPMAMGSEPLRRFVRGTRVMNSGADAMSRLLAPRDTPHPTHPIWGYTVVRRQKSPRCLRVPPQANPYLCAPPPPIPGPPASSSSATHADTPANLSDSPGAHACSSGNHSSSTISSVGRLSIIPHSLSSSENSYTASVKRRRKPVCKPGLDEDRGATGPLINIYRLIEAQKFDGSFHIADEYVAELLGSRMDSVPQTCDGDKVAWVALLIAVLLERKCAYLRDVWGLVVRKIWVFLSGREGVRVGEMKVVAEELVAGWE